MWVFLKKIAFNRLFSAGEVVTDKTETEWDDGILKIARSNYSPIVEESGLFVKCSRIFITDAIQYSVTFAKKNQKCNWLWVWLRELRNILMQLDI